MIALARHAPMTSTGSARPARDLLATVERWAERHRQRRALLALNDPMLKDIGLSTADAWREGSKPFWRA
jgi:uncharacterized protein YjiS (DUF1127 family)